MNLEQISNWAEIIEAVVIIVSLIYLALQVQQNTRMTRATAAQAQVDAYSSVIAPLVQSKDAALAWYRGLKDIKTLKPAEIVQFFASANMFFKMIEASYFQHKAGALDTPLWEGMARLAQEFAGQKGMQQFLEVRGHFYSDEFQAWLKETRAEFPEGHGP